MKILEWLAHFFSGFNFNRNLGWKIFSLVFAICTWFVVINITNPIEVWTFSMRLALDGSDELIAINNVMVQNQKALENTNVTAKIRGNRLALEELNKNKSDLYAAANLGIIYNFTMNGEVLAPIDIIIPSLPGVTPDKFDVVSKSPQYAKILLEEIVTEKRSVHVLTVGEPTDGYVAFEPSCNPAEVTITGPKSKLAQVQTVAVEVSVEGKTADANVLIPPELLDRDLNVVEGVTCDTAFVDVVLKVNRCKKVPVIASYVGAPAEGYVITGIDWTPNSLEIVGSEEDVKKLTEIRLTPLNVMGLSRTNVKNYDINDMAILPENVGIRNGTPNSVTVTVSIEKSTQKRLEIPVSSIELRGKTPDYLLSVTDSVVEFIVSGSESDLAKLNNGSVKLSIDLSDYGVGEHTIPAAAELPPGVTYAGHAPLVNVKIANN